MQLWNGAMRQYENAVRFENLEFQYAEHDIFKQEKSEDKIEKWRGWFVRHGVWCLFVSLRQRCWHICDVFCHACLTE